MEDTKLTKKPRDWYSILRLAAGCLLLLAAIVFYDALPLPAFVWIGVAGTILVVGDFYITQRLAKLRGAR